MYIGATGKCIPGYAYFAPQNLASPIMQASLLVSIETIQVRLRLELFGLYQFQAHLVFPPYSPSSTTTTCAAYFYFQSLSPSTPLLSQFLRNRTIVPSPQEKPKDLGKHGYRIEQRHFAIGRKSRGNLKADVYTLKRKLRGFLLRAEKSDLKFRSPLITRYICIIRNHLLALIYMNLKFREAAQK